MLVRTRHVIDTAGADAVIAAAEAAARAQGARVYICVVDPSGEVVAMRRTDGAQVASARVAVFDAVGEPVGAIDVPGAVHLAFGEPGRIYITADTAVWAATTIDTKES